MDNATTLPTDVPTLHLMLREQQQLIESLKANLHRLLKWRFGPKSEVLDVDQFGLFADGSLVIELPPFEPAAEAKQSASTAPPAERRRAVRVLKSLPRLIEQIDVPEEQKTCPCCGERMSAFGHESSEQLHYIPARLEVHETQRLKYCCGHCHGAVVRAQLPVLPPIPKSMASASPLAYLIVSKFADGLPLYRIAGRLARLVPKSINTMTYKSGIYPPPMAPLAAKEGGLCQENALSASSYRTLNERASKPRLGDIRHRIGTSSAPRSCCTPPRGSRTTRSQPAWTHRARLSASGASASSESVYGGWRSAPAPGAQRSFPPSLVVAIKALACQLPYESEVPLSRWSLPEIRREVIERGLVASIGQSTLWRWLTEDAIRPWSHRTWIFPRDPAFERKAVRVLDLYHGEWEGKPLSPSDCILSTDEKTSIQARRRIHPTLPTAPARLMRVEHEYQRCGAWAYLAAWDVRNARIFGRCERKTGLRPFGRLLAQVMRQEPYRSAPRVFWIMDNGSSHRGQACIRRLQRRWPTVIPVHTPVHASWLNQIEVYFSIVQRKVLTPNDFQSLAEVKDRLLRFQDHYCAAARPFQWKFSREDLRALLAKIGAHEKTFRKAAA